MNHEQKEFLEKQLLQYPELIPLRLKLLSIGGLEIVPREELDVEKILSRGKLIEKPVKLTGDPSSRCHSNSARIWYNNQDDCRIVTGWALSDDGLWRQHTWVIVGDDLLETTSERLKYFGFILNEMESLNFAYSNTCIQGVKYV